MTDEQIYESILAYKRFEEYIIERLREEKKDPDQKSDVDNDNYEIGYLMDKKFIDSWKKYTGYDKIKNRLAYYENESVIRNLIKQYKGKFIRGNSSPNYFVNAIDLYKKVKTRDKDEEYKEYVLVDRYFLKLLNLSKTDVNKKIKYTVKNRKLIFDFLDSKLIIDTKDNTILKDTEMTVKLDDVDEEDYLSLKHLLLLYAFEQEMKNKINNLKYCSHHWKDFYLIKKEWIDQYKKYYHFNEIFKLTNGKPEIRDVLNNGFNNAKFKLDIAICALIVERKKYIKNFPDILKQSIFLNEENSVEISNTPDIRYYTNFVIFNEELKTLFLERYYKNYNLPYEIKAKGLICGGKIILDISNINPGRYIFEIGSLRNKDVMFIDEYLFSYDSEEDKNNHFEFFKDKFYLFQKDELDFDINLECDLIDEEGNAVGIGFKIPPHK